MNILSETQNVSILKSLFWHLFLLACSFSERCYSGESPRYERSAKSTQGTTNLPRPPRRFATQSALNPLSAALEQTAGGGEFTKVLPGQMKAVTRASHQKRRVG